MLTLFIHGPLACRYVNSQDIFHLQEVNDDIMEILNLLDGLQFSLLRRSLVQMLEKILLEHT